ncbi:MAG TPA: hypothetical protein PKZ16_02470 [bacterium]|nr:hypothetical protein [bacterium]HPL95811.1 hypothetical protein [bacterium]
MSDISQELKNIILNHPKLSEEDKQQLADLVDGLGEDARNYFWSLIKDEPENLMVINQYFKEKSAAFATHDPKQIEDVLTKHYEQILAIV